MGSAEEQELILYALVDGDYIPVKGIPDIDVEETCKGCSNHPHNGGPGFCCCILGNKVWY